MSETKCFLLVETNKVARYLRRYSKHEWDRDLNKGFYARPCPNSEHGHHGITRIDDALAKFSPEGYYSGGGDWPHDDPRWPKECVDCGYVFQDDDAWMMNNKLLYATPFGTEVTQEEAPPGSMWWCDYLNNSFHPQLGRAFQVKLPDGTDWIPDSQASNCTIPDDHSQEKHHCWVITGTELPNITVGKGGVTCSAGAGSIQSHKGWHGFLTNGVLVGD